MTIPTPQPGDDGPPFQPQAPVRWFNPAILARAGLRVLLAAAFGTFLDKRELQSGLDSGVIEGHEQRQELWLDYIADTADGFDATYTIAWLLAQPHLQPDGADRLLRRGDLLVAGGDQVYPVANATEYENRFVGPFRAAFPWQETDNPELVTIPGNHDWYDGLTSFIRIFCQHAYIGGWRTRQARSYFAVPLPHRWWLWGIDIQLSTYIDEPQLDYFRTVADKIGPGDQIILCVAEPSWVDAADNVAAFRNLAFVERHLIAPTGARLALTLSGDSHHYARYAAQDGAQKITAGGGGAFTHLTHTLPEKLSVSVYPDGRDPVRHDRKSCYPDQVTSRRLLWGCLALGVRNPKFLSVPAGLAAFLLWANPAARTDAAQALRLEPATAAPTFSELATGLVASPLMIGVVLVVVALLIGFAKPPARFAGTARLIVKAVMGILHGIAQLVAVVVVSWVVLRVPLGPGTGGGLSLVKLIVQAMLGGVAGSVVLGAYLAICNSLPRRFHTHDREASSCMRLERWKSFVRLHIDPQGTLTVYPIGIDEVCHDWRPNPDAPDRSAPRYVPAHDLRPRIIDGPVVISDPAVLATGSSSGVGA